MDICPFLVRMWQNETVIAISDAFHLKQMTDFHWVTVSFHFKYWVWWITSKITEEWVPSASHSATNTDLFLMYHKISTLLKYRKPWPYNVLSFLVRGIGIFSFLSVTQFMARSGVKHCKSGISDSLHQNMGDRNWSSCPGLDSAQQYTPLSLTPMTFD